VQDCVGYSGGIRAFSDGSYAIVSNIWHGGSGAVTFANGPLKGTVTASNSVLGTTSGYGMNTAYDPVTHLLIVGRPSDNIVSLWDTDKLFANGFEP
jgi:hypothetical protein